MAHRGAVVGLRGAVVGLRGAAVGVRGAAVGNIGIPTYVISRGAVVRQPTTTPQKEMQDSSSFRSAVIKLDTLQKIRKSQKNEWTVTFFVSLIF